MKLTDYAAVTLKVPVTCSSCGNVNHLTMGPLSGASLEHLLSTTLGTYIHCSTCGYPHHISLIGISLENGVELSKPRGLQRLVNSVKGWKTSFKTLWANSVFGALSKIFLVLLTLSNVIVIIWSVFRLAS